MAKYRSFRELTENEQEGRDYQIHRRYGKSGILVMAPHGGDTEPGTTEIAEAVAGADHSFYSFDTSKKRGNFDLHITSRHFDEPVGISMARNSETILAIHGCKGGEEVAFIGGKERRLKEKVRDALSQALFSVREEPRFPGANPQNICNQGRRKKGVQLEISAGLRRAMFDGLSRRQRKGTTELFDRFVVAVRGALSNS